MKNRVSLHKGRVGSAKHNEHEFMHDEKDISGRAFCGSKGMTLEEREIDFYAKRYGEALELQNQKYRERRQYSRVKTIEQFYRSVRYRPVEEIIQYGNVDSEDYPDCDTYELIVQDYVGWKRSWSASHGNHLQVLDYMNHFDETCEHSHLRDIWDYVDEDGVIRVGQEEGMKQAGIELPYPDQPESRRNNRGVTWTKMCREKWQDLCEEYGFAVERSPLPTKKPSETVGQYRARRDREIEEREQRAIEMEQKASQRLSEASEAIKAKQSVLNDLEAAIMAKTAEYDDLKKKTVATAKKYKDFTEYFDDTVNDKTVALSETLAKGRFVRLIEEHGEDFVEMKNGKRTRRNAKGWLDHYKDEAEADRQRLIADSKAEREFAAKTAELHSQNNEHSGYQLG